MRPLAITALFLSISACTHMEVYPTAEPELVDESEASPKANLFQSQRPPDGTCMQYSGEYCVSPVHRLPDSTCRMYSNDVCIDPVLSRTPDSSCAQYQGQTCVSPISKPADANCEVYGGDVCIAPIVR